MAFNLQLGDCVEAMREMPEAGVDAVVTDPPYGLEFMGKEWDKLDGGLPQESVWKGRRGKGGSKIGSDHSQPSSRHKVSFGSKIHGFKRCKKCSKREFSGSPCKCDEPDWEIEHAQRAPTGVIRMQRWHELWAREAYRVLKPGGFLLAFGGTRTYHRLACAVEDAGFEIRDSIDWITGQGFPKGLDVAWEMHLMACTLCGIMVEYDHEKARLDTGTVESQKIRTTGKESKTEHNLRFVRAIYLQTPVYACAKCGQVLQPFMSKQEAQALRTSWSESQIDWPEQSCMEGRGDVETVEGELSRCQVCKMSTGIFADGSEGWLRDGTSAGDGAIPWQMSNADGSRPSYRPQSCEQLFQQSEALRIERIAQTRRGTNVALKPAHEPIVVARKPLIGTVVVNVLKHGTGGINVDGCRVGTDKVQINTWDDGAKPFGGGAGHKYTGRESSGRWPPNVLMTHSEGCRPIGKRKVKGDNRGDCQGKRLGGFGDVGAESGDAEPNAPVYGDDEIEAWECVEGCPVLELDRQSNAGGMHSAGGEILKGQLEATTSFFGQGGSVPLYRYGDGDSASRFFPCFRYVAKASRAEREAGCEGLERKTAGECTDRQDDTAGLNSPRAGAGRTGGARNFHPTVKPIELMRWLVRLVTPPGGVVLDPFMGSGTTGIACHKERFGFIGIELDKDYFKIAEARIAAARAQLRLF